MPCLLNIFLKNLELLSLQEQLIEINNLIYFINTANFNFTVYATNKKYELLLQLNKMKKNLLNKVNT